MSTIKSGSNVPSYRRQKSSRPGLADRAFVVLNGQRHYLGVWESPESRTAYDAAVAAWLAAGRMAATAAATGGQAKPLAVTIRTILVEFKRYAESHYRKADGAQTSEFNNYITVMRLMRQRFSELPARDFGPLALRELRQQMIVLGWSRSTINRMVGRVRYIFGHGASLELIGGDQVTALEKLPPLRRGYPGVREAQPVRPADPAAVEAIKPYVSRQVWALIELQQLCGARSGELLKLRAIDIDVTGEVWTFTPAHHKNSHRGQDRVICFGPRAQQVLSEFMAGRKVDAYLFSPIEAERERLEALHAKRTTPASCGNTPGSNRKAKPQREPGEFFTVASYRRAIARACDQAFPPAGELARLMVPGDRGHKRRESVAEWRTRLGADKWPQVQAWISEHRWHPHQLRHTAGTNLRRDFGLEAAQVVLGHKSASVTQIYAERNQQKAMEVMAKVG